LGPRKATQLLGPSRPVETLTRGDISTASNQRKEEDPTTNEQRFKILGCVLKSKETETLHVTGDRDTDKFFPKHAGHDSGSGWAPITDDYCGNTSIFGDAQSGVTVTGEIKFKLLLFLSFNLAMEQPGRQPCRYLFQARSGRYEEKLNLKFDLSPSNAECSHGAWNLLQFES
jgi:hypothetical protein